jgi:two-component system OmpR family response regulator
MRVLVVEDQPRRGKLIRRALRGAGEVADVATRGEDALWSATATSYDVIVMDVMLPGIDGFDTCRRLRESGVLTPILLLSARDALADRIAGLDGGADDYVVEPFEIDELLARLRALARRGGVRHLPVLQVGTLRLDPATRCVWRGETEIELSPKEFGLLEVFMRNPGVVLGRLDLLDGAWDNGYENRSNVISVHIHHLRDKIDRPFGLESIETVRGAGYRLRSDVRT